AREPASGAHLERRGIRIVTRTVAAPAGCIRCRPALHVMGLAMALVGALRPDARRNTAAGCRLYRQRRARWDRAFLLALGGRAGTLPYVPLRSYRYRLEMTT